MLWGGQSQVAETLLAIQDEIAAEVAEQLSATLLGTVRSVQEINTEAYPLVTAGPRFSH